MRQDLLDLLARVEAALDFPEEAGELDPASVQEALDRHQGALKALAETYEAGRLLREGLLVVIAGRPNVGKSSLLNRLLDRERAIVTEIPGTTRDLVEESITLGGVVVRFSDTAGLRPAQDRLEALGIERTRERLQQADLVLYLVDASHPLAPEDGAALAELAGQPGLVVINKIDLPGSLSEAELSGITAWPLTKISAKTGQGIEALQEKIVAQALGGGLKVAGEVITQARHHEHLRQCLAYLGQARALLGPYENVPRAALGTGGPGAGVRHPRTGGDHRGGSGGGHPGPHLRPVLFGEMNRGHWVSREGAWGLRRRLVRPIQTSSLHDHSWFFCRGAPKSAPRVDKQVRPCKSSAQWKVS